MSIGGFDLSSFTLFVLSSFKSGGALGPPLSDLLLSEGANCSLCPPMSTSDSSMYEAALAASKMDRFVPEF